MRAALTTIAAVALLAGCAQAVDGTPASPFPTTATALTDEVTAAAARLKSAHLELHETLAGQSIDVTADEQLSGGKATALVIDETIPQFGTVRLVRVGGKTYARIPASQRTSGKPWILVRAGSSNPFVTALAQALSSADQFTGFTVFTEFLGAASGFRLAGTAIVGGVTAGHYTLTLEVDRLPDDFPQKQALQQAGLGKVPLDFWVDSVGHIRKVSESLDVVGQHVTVVGTLGDFDAPVHITAPPAGQVDSS